MGTDAKDLFLEARLFLIPSSYLELSYDQTERSFPGKWPPACAAVPWKRWYTPSVSGKACATPDASRKKTRIA